MIRPVLAHLALCAASFLTQAVLGEDDKPNILFIYTDDQSYRTVSCYPGSYDFVQTPNIDALARRGIRFDAAYIGTWCMPSRASLLTGHLQHGVNSMRMEGEYPGSEYDPEPMCAAGVDGGADGRPHPFTRSVVHLDPCINVHHHLNHPHCGGVAPSVR